MTSTFPRIKDAQSVITLPSPVRSTLARGKVATFDVGQFMITIIPKQKNKRVGIARRQRRDDALWRKIEAGYRTIRSQVTRERYPYLFGY